MHSRVEFASLDRVCSQMSQTADAVSPGRGCAGNASKHEPFPIQRHRNKPAADILKRDLFCRNLVSRAESAIAVRQRMSITNARRAGFRLPPGAREPK